MKALRRFGFASGVARWAALGGLWLGACGPRQEIGSDLLWSAGHESNDLNEWYAMPKGGLLPVDSTSTVLPVAGPSHRGRYSLKLTDLAASDTIGPGVFRELIAPPDAYYSAWYYIPRLYQTKSQWTIMKFQARSDLDVSLINHGHDLNLRTLPGGQMILYVYSHDPTYLQAPLADPPAFVPVETWFHLEAMFRPRTDDTGKLLVWLDDRLVYDLENRKTSSSDDVLWAPCNIGMDVSPFGTPSDEPGLGEAGSSGDAGAAGEASLAAGGTGGEGSGGASAAAGGASTRIPPELYMDDAAISLRRVTRSGSLFDDR